MITIIITSSKSNINQLTDGYVPAYGLDRLVHPTLPELEFVLFDDTTTCLARAFNGLSLIKEAQAARASSKTT